MSKSTWPAAHRIGWGIVPRFDSKDVPMRYAMFLMATAIALTAPIAADAAQYTVLIYETPTELALRSARDAGGAAYWQAFAAYGKAMSDAGILRGGAALTIPAEADAATPTGYFIIDVPTEQDARAWAAKAPSVAHGSRAVARSHVSMAGK